MTASPTHIAVRWRGKKKSADNVDQECVIGEHFNIRADVLQDFSAELLTDAEQDLVVLAGAVAYADRVICRQRSKGWARSIRLSVPVLAGRTWKQSAVLRSLTDTLDYLTGDHWEFDFTSGGKSLTIPQSSLDFTRGNYVVVPFSEGLDSYLQWQLLLKEEPAANVLRVHTKSRASSNSRNSRIDLAGDPKGQRLSMPVSLSTKDHPEPTYRTRTFLFYVIAALAAHKVGSTRVVIGENGVGALGPSMVPFGDECPHRTTHPAFTRRLAGFLNHALGGQIVFEHPQQYRTKGQVLRRATDLGVTGWQETRSCTRGGRNKLLKLPCGLCGGCLLRRTAIQAAGQPEETYFWNDLSHASLDACRSKSNGRPSTPTDADIARHGISGMSAFAALGEDAKSPAFEKTAWELVRRIGPDLASAATEIAELARTHAREWRDFRERFDVQGFLHRQQED